MKYSWSAFNVKYALPRENAVAIKNYLSGALVKMTAADLTFIERWLDSDQSTQSVAATIETLVECGILSCFEDGIGNYKEEFLRIRNDQADLLAVHILPTLKCQLDCQYCVEKGIKRIGRMNPQLTARSIEWLNEYVKVNREIKTCRFVLFGGEPLLEKAWVIDTLPRFKDMIIRSELEFFTEIVTNGELFDEQVAYALKACNLKRVQITLDGPKHVHDARRRRLNGSGTFDNIIGSIRMLLDGDFVGSVDVRMSMDKETVDHVPDLVRFLSGLGYTDRVNLSLGLVVPTIQHPMGSIDELEMADKAISVWSLAKSLGFRIPSQFVAGPWCVAIAKHSMVIQPNGALQKCFCTAGRPEFDFGTVNDSPASYAQDERFERFRRVDECLSEKCPYVPICGGGCVHDSFVRHGAEGFHKRLCQKDLVSRLNEGLIRLRCS